MINGRRYAQKSHVIVLHSRLVMHSSFNPLEAASPGLAIESFICAFFRPKEHHPELTGWLMPGLVVVCSSACTDTAKRKFDQ